MFKIWDIYRKRYLSDEELETQSYQTGQFDRSYPEPNEYTAPFKINLLTGKIQTNQDSSCNGENCCFPREMFADDDNFKLTVDGGWLMICLCGYEIKILKFIRSNIDHLIELQREQKKNG